ncbi:hypothetical protein M1O15_01090 [Streptomyces lichenis]|uniref:Uncharacterized protein n=2 Tax=Streptomyces lichenis TaxID=2306967 RepID=A0ABT0I3X7_9ACTN|nr:hypothetical protein [Streptomyces lichenis]MCK8676030.1 hypothetical protein [Streptomyces lichenis]
MPTSGGSTEHASDGSPSSAAKIKEAVQARDALADALTRAGIQLPAMDVRTPWAEDREDERRYALVHLGVCSAPVAYALAEVIAKGIANGLSS